MRIAVALITLAITATVASAQPMMPQGPVMRPTVSPYVNLLGNRNGFGGATASNFFGIVRPEQQFRTQANSLQQQLQNTNQNLNGVASQLMASSDGTNPLITGKGSTFNNTSHYFNNLNGGGGGGFGMGGGSSGGRSSGSGTGSSAMSSNMNRSIGQSPQGGGRSKR